MKTKPLLIMFLLSFLVTIGQTKIQKNKYHKKTRRVSQTNRKMNELIHEDFGGVHVFKERVENPRGRSKAIMLLSFVTTKYPDKTEYFYFKNEEEVDVYIECVKEAKKNLLSHNPVDPKQECKVEADRLIGKIMIWNEERTAFSLLDKKDIEGFIKALYLLKE